MPRAAAAAASKPSPKAVPKGSKTQTSMTRTPSRRKAGVNSSTPLRGRRPAGGGMGAPPAIDEIIARFARANPNPRCELYYETPYQLMVSVILSAQATDKSVNKAMEPHYRKGFTPSTVTKLGEPGLLSLIRTIGLAPTKARNIVRATAILQTRHRGEVPSTREMLEALPGVGRKTANVLLGELFGEPTLAVDTHVFRVTQRLGWHQESSAEKCETRLLKIVPRAHLPRAHHWLILHGRYTCTARNPKCETCCVADLCPSTTVAE